MIAPGDCTLQPSDACVDGPGMRRLLRFSVLVLNRGTADLFLGTPSADDPLFVFSECHNHFHFESFASYELRPRGGTTAVKHMVTWGGGSSFAEYAIHPLELLVSCLGAAAQSMMRRGTAEYSQLLVNFSNGRTGVANVYTHGDTPFAASVTTPKETKILTVDTSKIFVNNAAAVLDLFESRKPSVDREETIIIRRILDVAEDPAALTGFVTL